MCQAKHLPGLYPVCSRDPFSDTSPEPSHPCSDCDLGPSQAKSVFVAKKKNCAQFSAMLVSARPWKLLLTTTSCGHPQPNDLLHK